MTTKRTGNAEDRRTRAFRVQNSRYFFGKFLLGRVYKDEKPAFGPLAVSPNQQTVRER